MNGPSASSRRFELWPIGALDQKREQKLKSHLDPADYSPADKRLASLKDSPTTVIPLWPGDGTRADDPARNLTEGVPERGDGILRIQNVTKPSLHLWKPKKQNGKCVIVFPGGGYGILAAEHEGTEVAEWLNKQGITAFVAKYRVPRRKGLEKHHVALQDAQRAIRLVRSRASEFGIDPSKIGVLGFSAGGHLTTLCIHQSGVPSYEPIDEIDKASAAPNFAIPIYPAYLTTDNKSGQLDPLFASLKPSDFPPLFMTIAADDDRFIPGNLHYLLKLEKEGISYEFHVYPKGGHGKGLRKTGYPFSQWTVPCERWLKDL